MTQFGRIDDKAPAAVASMVDIGLPRNSDPPETQLQHYQAVMLTSALPTRLIADYSLN